MAFAWNIPASADYTIGTNIADDWLAAINTHFVANSGGGSAIWEVATYASTSPRYIILRRKSLAAGRIIIFGQQGSTANAGAVRATATASHLYIGYSKTSTATTEDASWLSAAPLSASDYITGLSCWPITASVTGRFTYAECTSGVHLLASVVANGMAFASAGELMVDPSAADVSVVHGTGTTWATTNWGVSTTALIDTTIGSDTSYTTGQAATVARLSSANHIIYRVFSLPADQQSIQMQDPGSLKVWFFPIAMICSSTYLADGVIGKWKQMAFGPKILRETTWLNAGTGLRNAYGHAYHTSTLAEGLFFVEFDI